MAQISVCILLMKFLSAASLIELVSVVSIPLMFCSNIHMVDVSFGSIGSPQVLSMLRCPSSGSVWASILGLGDVCVGCLFAACCLLVLFSTVVSISIVFASIVVVLVPWNWLSVWSVFLFS